MHLTTLHCSHPELFAVPNRPRFSLNLLPPPFHGCSDRTNSILVFNSCSDCLFTCLVQGFTTEASAPSTIPALLQCLVNACWLNKQHPEEMNKTGFQLSKAYKRKTYKQQVNLQGRMNKHRKVGSTLQHNQGETIPPEERSLFFRNPSDLNTSPCLRDEMLTELFCRHVMSSSVK